MIESNLIKGKRPEMFDSPGVDYLIHMVMVLTQELNVVTDKLDTLQRLVADKDVVSLDEMEAYAPDHEVLEAREERRQQMLETLFSVIYQEAAEIERKDSKQNYDKTISDIASDK